MLRKLNLLSGVIALTCGLGAQAKIAIYYATSFSEFTQLSNGDWVKGDSAGSITEELASYDINILDYQMGYYGNTTLMISTDNLNQVYFYFYNSNGFEYDYDTVSIGYYEGSLSNYNYDSLVYYEYDIELIAFDYTGTCFKYFISGLTVSDTLDYVILIRQIYVEANKDDSEFINGIGMIYQYDQSTGLSKLDQEEVVTITDKTVNYALYNYQTTTDKNYTSEYTVNGLWQRNYVAFSTNRDIDDLLSVKLKYDGFYWAGQVKLDYEYEGKANGNPNFAEYAKNKDLISLVESDGFVKLNEFSDLTLTVYPKDISFTNSYLNGFWSYFFAEAKSTESHEYNYIEKTSELDPDEDNIVDEDIYNYQFVVSFENHYVETAAYVHARFLSSGDEPEAEGSLLFGVQDYPQIYLWGMTTTGTSTFYSSHWALNFSGTNPNCVTYDFVYDIENNYIYYSDYTNAMLQVEDLTILELCFTYENETHQAVVVDTYTDSTGGWNYDEPTEEDGLSRLEIVWNNIVNWWNENVVNSVWWTVIKWGGICILALIAFGVIYKALMLIISLFKK